MEWLAVFILINIYQASRSTTHDQPFEKLGSSLSLEREATGYCDKDWFPFGDKCYKIGGTFSTSKPNWSAAKDMCSQDGGTLVAVTSKEIQDFLVAFLLLSAREDVWIGLHLNKNETSYHWDDGSSFNYSNWLPNEPTRTLPLMTHIKEECVEMVLLKEGQVGGWNDIHCNHQRNFICQTNKATEIKKNDNPMLCSSEPEGGWKLGNSCFHLVRDQKSWYDAETYCQKTYQGHLATVKDLLIETFLNYVFRGEKFWIGIQIKEHWQQKWVSGWHVSHNNWEKEKTEFKNGTCILREKKNRWITVPCSGKHFFICEESNDFPPVLKPSVENSFCPTDPNDWRDLGGDYCYYFEIKNYAIWEDALLNCMKRGGSLASIHSQLENDVISPFVVHGTPVMYIGLYRQVLIDNKFVWTDGSPVDFLSWAPNEPNNRKELCGELLYNKKWNDVNCSWERGYICSIRKILPNITIETPERTCSGGVSRQILIAVPLGLFLAAVLLVVVIYYFRCKRKQETAKVSRDSFPHSFGDRPRCRGPSNYCQELVINEDAVYEDVQPIID